MMKSEFEELCNCTISAGAYSVIETVYNFHPSISNTDGKQQVKMLFDNFGIAIFYDMLARATKCRDIEQRINDYNAKIYELKKEYKELQMLTNCEH